MRTNLLSSLSKRAKDYIYYDIKPILIALNSMNVTIPHSTYLNEVLLVPSVLRTYITLERTFKPIIPQLYHNHLPLYLDLNRRSNKLSGSGVEDVRTLSQSMFGDYGGWLLVGVKTALHSNG